MARTKTYTAQVKNAITYANKKIRDVEKLFGAESAQYQRYVNVVTAALPPGAYTISDTGRVRIKADKATVARVKKGEVRPVTKLPTASKSLNMAKKEIAKNKLQIAGIAKPTNDEIDAEAITIEDTEALEELAAKSFIEGLENEKGKLHYDESVRAEMSAAGKKSYTELRKIIERGQANAAKRDKKREYAKAYREAHKEQRAEYQRAYREKNRAEVNRKQREYRARKRAAGDT